MKPTQTPTLRQGKNLPTLSRDGENIRSISKGQSAGSIKTENIISESSYKDLIDKKIVHGNQLIIKANKEFEILNKENETKRKNSSGNN